MSRSAYRNIEVSNPAPRRSYGLDRTNGGGTGGGMRFVGVPSPSRSMVKKGSFWRIDAGELDAT
eukprot:scaffold171789_cov27-Tisochrysis_lutea.AAC.2